MLGKAAKDGRAAAENRKKVLFFFLRSKTRENFTFQIGVIPSQFFSMETVNDLQSPDVV